LLHHRSVLRALDRLIAGEKQIRLLGALSPINPTEQTNSIVDDDVEQNDVSQNIIQGLQNKTVSNDVWMEKSR
jgi:hypothetical protein